MPEVFRKRKENKNKEFVISPHSFPTHAKSVPFLLKKQSTSIMKKKSSTFRNY
jgi:hypothetical protein